MKAPFRRTRGDSPTPESPSIDGAPPIVDQPTVVAPAVPAPPVTLDPPPAEPPVAPTAGNRGKLRRRMRYLRRAHELGLRDLGGLVFDLHRFGKRNDQLVVGKLHALEVVDAELRAIEHALGAQREVIELREPGITACVRCGGLHGTEDRFCPSCGTQVDGLVAVGGVPTAVAPSPAPVAPASAAPPIAGPAPPVPASGPAPAAPPLWSVPAESSDDASAPPPEAHS